MIPLPPRRIPPRGPGKSSARQRILAQWRGVDLAPLEKARATTSKSAASVLPKVLGELRIDRRQAEAEIMKVWNSLIDPNVVKHAQPTGLNNAMLDYDWGPNFNYVDGSGVPSKVPPDVRNVIRMKVPRVDADGNELGGVPIVLREAPHGTYMGFNIVADGFHKGMICNYAAGMIPFATTRAERMANNDPRPSLEERYRSHDGYVEAVKTAAAKAVSDGFQLQADADRLVAQAQASNVLAQSNTSWK